MSAEDYRIRPARLDDLELLAELEIDAFQALSDAGGVEGEPRSMPRRELEASLDNNLLWVAAAAEGERLVGFLAASLSDDRLYVAELDVARDWQRRGIGRRLMASAIDEARRRQLRGVTLTTDRFVAFNAPLYARLGFVEICEGDDLPVLRESHEKEIARGMHADRRVAMVLRFV